MKLRESIAMASQTVRRSANRYGLHPLKFAASLNEQLVFIVGCPRSGTTFIASALGSVNGFADIGEVPPLKSAIPTLYGQVEDGQESEVLKKLRRILSFSQRLAMIAPNRAIEQTPETTFLIPQLARAYPSAHFIHMIRDARDVAASLLERGWLSTDITRASIRDGRPVDDGGHRFGSHSRFWVEHGKRSLFASVSEAERCGWAWKRYTSFCLDSLASLDSSRSTTIRYEELATNYTLAVSRLAKSLDLSDRDQEDLATALSSAHSRSVGRWKSALTPTEVVDVMVHASSLIRRLGYSI